MKVVFIFLLLVMFCSYNYSSDVENLTNKVTSKATTIIKNSCQLKVCGSGGGALSGVEELSLVFSTEKGLSIGEARRLMVKSVEIYLDNINSEKSLRPLLVEYPFPANRLRMHIYTHENMPYSSRKPKELISCDLFRGKIEYSTINEPLLSRAHGQEIIMHKETYEEAKKIVENEKST